MDNEELVINIEQFKNGLISRATGGDFSELDYKSGRDLILSNPSLSKLVPIYVKTCRTPNEFWNYIKGKFSTYQERREYLTNDLNTIIYAIEYDHPASLVNEESYEIGDQLGNGGFGEVYKFHHKLLDLDFAVKILDPLFVDGDKNDECCQCFFREAKILFLLDHPNIVKFYDLGYYKNKPFIRMEFVDGYDMNAFMEKYSTVNFERSKKPIIALLEGLSYAHSKGIIHRDLKPSNFMVTSKGNFKIIDFGISAYSEISGHTKITKTGESIAGGLYTDPCLIENPKLRDSRSDIYSVGAIWYFLLTGKAPSGADMKDYLLESAEITNLQANVIMKCLSRNINERYLTCEELLSILRPIRQEKNDHLPLLNRITEVTHADIIEFLIKTYNAQMDEYVCNVPINESYDEYVFTFSGRKNDVDFLKRIYKLAEMPTKDSRVKNFQEEIYLHTVTNEDYSAWWVFDDERLSLSNGDDETLLKFLCEMFHPAIRKKESNWEFILKEINNLLRADGYEIYESGKISNKSVYSYRSII